ncbi:c-type cytochrome [Sphingomonas swuensis]|uniref:c-type cytochrome n=1 Tax=Sphingomonas swuensis TaxID=977800 RepID=UPI003CD05AC0
MRRLFPLALLALAACKPPPDQRQFLAEGDAGRGLQAIKRAGCGSCHQVPGLRWPEGKVGPRLDGLAERALIAGQLPNRPDVLTTYIRNAPALVPGSAMPAMPVSDTEARDIAAYLYDQGAK